MTDNVDPLLRKALKLLLLQLAAKYDKPSVHLEAILSEVILEIYNESKAQLDERKSRLRLVSPS